MHTHIWESSRWGARDYHQQALESPLDGRVEGGSEDFFVSSSMADIPGSLTNQESLGNGSGEVFIAGWQGSRQCHVTVRKARV